MAASADSERDYTVQSVARALDLLQVFTHERRRMRLSDIATAAGLTRSSCHRLLATLERAGFVSQISRGVYALGLTAAQVGSVAMRELSPPEAVIELLRELSHESSETAGMTILDGTQTVLVARAESPLPLRVLYGVGTRQPAAVTASGRVLLAGAPHRAELLSGIKLVSYTPATITDRDELARVIERAGADGYCVDREELHIGLSCLAVPVRNRAGEVMATAAISGPSMRLRFDSHLDRLVSMVRRYAAEIEVVM